MKSLKNAQPGSLSLFEEANLFDLRSDVRERARGLLGSFSEVLTEREKVILQWLAQGVDARDIAKSNQLFPPPPPAA